ncbi:MAG: polyphosphate kinase 1 [Anaerocolumna sp.]
MEKQYFNRELSWLAFNKRVLEESTDPGIPLLERLKFLSIFANNLDEFYMVRVGSLFGQSLIDNTTTDNKTNMTPSEQIHAINEEVKNLYYLRDKSYSGIMESLSAFDLIHIKCKNLSKNEKREIKNYFKLHIFPQLSPQIIDAKHPFPHIENKALYIALQLYSDKGNKYGVIPVKRELQRIYVTAGGKNFLLVEDIILLYSHLIFESYKVRNKAVIRVTRNTDFDISDDFYDDDIDYRNFMQNIIKARGRLHPVRFEISSCDDTSLLDYFSLKLGLKKSECFKLKSPLDLSYVRMLENICDSEVKRNLLYPTVRPQWPMDFPHHNIISSVLKEDYMLSLPYESFRPLLELLRESAEDEAVVSIKITLYRVASQSQIVQYLCTAAENGKDVTVAMELRARFDEQNNILWSNLMEESGCKIIYGIEKMKVHSKILLITRKSLENFDYITHIGTGNYNEMSARQYTDLGIITGNREIGTDAAAFFNNLAISNLQGEYTHLLVSPTSLKSGMIDLIDEECEKALSGESARIIAKMNNLTDKDIIDSLLKAGRAGVKISLIIRGICCLKPYAMDTTENIEVISIVGRFLEHSRIYSFGERQNARIYISSADMMTRNTEKRVEIAMPVLKQALSFRIFDMLTIMLSDNVKARVLQPDGSYIYKTTDKEPLDSQMLFYEESYQNNGFYPY